MQGDTANTVEINLALALRDYGIKNVDFATVWGEGHTMAEETGQPSRARRPSALGCAPSSPLVPRR